tara:strand:+ start:130 stop:276 length:147 start_codon:yes stop_codon:yes gene_type:complete
MVIVFTKEQGLNTNETNFVEGEGFEPPEGINPRWFSRPVHSARLCHPS